MRGKRIDLQRVLIIGGAVSLLVYYAIQWTRMIADPSMRTSFDFIAYYSAGRIAREYGMSKVYDVDAQHAMEKQVVGYNLGEEQVLLFLHMPYLLPVLYLIVSENYAASFVRWDLLMIALYVIGFSLFSKWLAAGTDADRRRRFMIEAVTFFPCFVSLLLGQNTAILFLGITLLAWGTARGRLWLAGLGMALITVRPQLVLLMMLPVFILNRGVFWRFTAISATLAIGSILLLGLDGTASFVHTMFLGAGGDWYGLRVDTMINVNGFLLRNVPSLGTGVIHLIAWTCYAASIPLLAILARRAAGLDVHFLGQMILISMVGVPHLQYHDLTLLLFPLLSAGLRVNAIPVFNRLKFVFHPMISSYLFMFGLLQRTVFPSLMVSLLFPAIFGKGANTDVQR